MVGAISAIIQRGSGHRTHLLAKLLSRGEKLGGDDMTHDVSMTSSVREIRALASFVLSLHSSGENLPLGT